MKEELEKAIIRLTKETNDIDSTRNLHRTQAVLNLTHALATVTNIEKE